MPWRFPSSRPRHTSGLVPPLSVCAHAAVPGWHWTHLAASRYKADDSIQVALRTAAIGRASGSSPAAVVYVLVYGVSRVVVCVCDILFSALHAPYEIPVLVRRLTRVISVRE